MSKETVTITDNSTGKEVELPLYTPVAGPKVIDIGALYKQLGYFTYDPGFMSTASCSSAITFLDGDKGVLQYRDSALARHNQLDAGQDALEFAACDGDFHSGSYLRM